MYYPTGKTTGGRMLVCMCCEDIIPNPVTDSPRSNPEAKVLSWFEISDG
jgi:hypothetical protein